MLPMFAQFKKLLNLNIRDIAGDGSPVDGTTGATEAGPGSIYTDYTNKVRYMNIGTLASPEWVQIGGAAGVQRATGTITSANITGTAAGQLGHANGVILVPAPGTGFINQLVAAILINDFAVAAYTGGGNTTINIGGGGAALTGLVSNANFIQSAADKIIEFVPLAATFNTYTNNNPINLVTASAPTQPGTAAGVFRYVVFYRKVAHGL